MTSPTQSGSGAFLVAGNWKMNGSPESLRSFHSAIKDVQADGADLALCLPAPLIAQAAKLFSDTSVAVGGQNCHSEQSGAFTGETSAELLADCGARFVILGHSERRTLFGETDAMVRDKTRAALASGLTVILCVGETSAERYEGRHLEVVLAQLAAAIPDEASAQDTIIAYEPVWAIGSGKSASTEQIAEMHDAIRRWSGDQGRRFQTLYGGSVKPETAAEIGVIEAVGGFLVGGASLDPNAFVKIANAVEENQT